MKKIYNKALIITAILLTIAYGLGWYFLDAKVPAIFCWSISMILIAFGLYLFNKKE
jgi:hypothetical protein